MKKIGLLFMILCVGFVGFAQKSTTIKGLVKHKRAPLVTLFSVENGMLKELMTAEMGKDSSYHFSFIPEKEGFYAVGDRKSSFDIYVKGGEAIHIDLLEKRAVLNGKNTRENKALYRWEDAVASIRTHATAMMGQVTYKEFFPELTEFLTKVDALKAGVSTGNKRFDDLLKRKIDHDIDFYAAVFLMMPRTVHPQREDWPEFYNTIISDKKFTSDDVLLFPSGMKMVSAYTNFAGLVKASVQGFTALNNDRLRGEAFLQRLTYCKFRTDFDGLMEKNGQFLVTEDQKIRAKKIGEKLIPSLAGKPAIDFTYPDVNGKAVSLSDFKGKVVVVDVWATWCGPCKGEIPALKKLEEEMRGRDVVFIWVSVDEAKDKQKWMNFVEKENLGGIQLHASGWSQITKDYGINGIPRFMVFDKQGNIVSESAPCPSSPLLKEMLEKELKKTTIHGMVKHKRTPIISLFSVENGAPKKLMTVNMAKDSSYRFSFIPEKAGFYVVGDFRLSFPVYVKGGENVHIDLLEKKAALTGENTRENKALYQWEDFSAGIRYQSIVTMVLHPSYKEFFPEFTKFVTKIDSVKGAINSGNPAYDELIRKKVDYNLDFYAMMFLATPRSIHPKREEWPAFYNTIVSDKKFTSDDILQFPEGLQTILAYTNFSQRINAPRQGEDALNNNRLRGEALLWKLEAAAKYSSDYDSFIEESGEFLTEDQKERAKVIAAKLIPSKTGQPANNFTYPDVNGKAVSLSDFKGKVVVVDVWATWCGPCKEELPFLKKLEEDMQGREVVFIGVALDEVKDKQKWIDFVKKQNLGGVQLHASGWGQIAKDYQIRSIPRFMLFDKKGNVVTENAPRPSSPLLKEMIEKELKK